MYILGRRRMIIDCMSCQNARARGTPHEAVVDRYKELGRDYRTLNRHAPELRLTTEFDMIDGG
jgi:hypothetical protein